MKLYNELAEYYFSIESPHRNINEEINLVLSYKPKNRTARILDLGCGTGEHLNILAGYGIKCMGLDTSPKMLNIAKKRKQHEIILKKQSMVNFDFYNDFDIIISIFGSFNYILNDVEIEKVFWNTFRALKSDGTAIFEIWNSAPILKIKEKEICHISRTKFNNTVIDRHRGFKLLNKDNRNLVTVDYKYNIIGPNRNETFQDSHTMRSFTIEEITKFIEGNGFTISNIYSNYKKEEYNNNSNKFILILKKR